ncbi:uncharacterized protein EV420DRAFT_1089383 [Desarmillaria tabescens]|uniref:Apple domain-containing protein n=1 Tax=Armillaria tabescens TaxID=1929756 RepID=A0AA39TLR5_ARMTA|nr:uncharacterized protein EV420DRAFT_1089383 [Desarmillaria tabescens]KAK0463452.1 hypothetical protein EV420DRAFT_1089383 [Desarmillaria tabescens]
MRFASSTFFATIATVALAVQGVSLVNTHLDGRAVETVASLSAKINKDNCYGAPVAPWKPGCSPGWYYGDHPPSGSLPCLKDGLICLILEILDLGFLCPPPPPLHPTPPNNGGGYEEVFSNYTGAVQSEVPGDYLTYGLVDTVQDCMIMCNNIKECFFFNTYHDVHGKNGSPLLTCSLFSKCHTIADADNRGGQTQPDGTVDYITDSAGYCNGTITKY